MHYHFPVIPGLINTKQRITRPAQVHNIKHPVLLKLATLGLLRERSTN